MSEQKTPNDIMRIVVPLLAQACMTLAIIFVISMSNNDASAKIDRLTSEVHDMRTALDSMDAKIGRDTTRIEKTRETVKVIEHQLDNIRADVAAMPADKLAKTFRDTALKYGGR